MEYSTGKEIYLYNEEDADVNITVNSTAGKIKRATVKAGSGQFTLKQKSDAAIAYAKGQSSTKPEEEEVEEETTLEEELKEEETSEEEVKEEETEGSEKPKGSKKGKKGKE